MAEWQQGLLGCFGDCGVCIVSCFMPCYAHGKTAEAVGDSCFLCGMSTFMPLLNWYTVTMTRGKVRERHGIPGTTMDDAVSSCCFVCSIAQQRVQMKVGDVGNGETMARS